MTNFKWISPKTITGDAATGDFHFRRGHINANFWEEVEKGNHILFVAPRRVGKTSIMKDLAGNPPDGYACIYQNIEGVKTKNEFYQRLFEIFLTCVSKATKAKTLFKTWSKRFGIEEIKTTGVKLQSKEIDFETELRGLITELKAVGLHVVVFLDEFAEVISKLAKQKKEQDAVDILHTLREIRSDEDFRHFTVIYAGSIGLQFVIKSIDRLKLINDLHPVETGALSKEEAVQLIEQLTKDATVQYPPDALNYLIEKISHLLPYYVQLMLEEIDLLLSKISQTEVSNSIIDQAFTNIVQRNKNFDDWLDRLKLYQPTHFPFINHILKTCAHNGKISIQEIYNIAGSEKYKRTEDYMDFVEELINDGYLIESEKHQYRFISPFLQHFWLKKFPVHNG